MADADLSQTALIIMQAITFGDSRVNQAGRDLHITMGSDRWSPPGSSPRNRQRRSLRGTCSLEAHAFAQARVNQAAGDVYLLYQAGARGATSGYDAFISYSHVLDGAAAHALQTELERFAKPWYRPRALRVFRDTTNLSNEFSRVLLRGSACSAPR